MNKLQPHQQRVVDEKNELDAKTEALSDFLRTDFFHTLSTDEQGRMRAQRLIMCAYSSILGSRIAAFAGVSAQ